MCHGAFPARPLDTRSTIDTLNLTVNTCTSFFPREIVDVISNPDVGVSVDRLVVTYPFCVKWPLAALVSPSRCRPAGVVLRQSAGSVRQVGPRVRRDHRPAERPAWKRGTHQGASPRDGALV